MALSVGVVVVVGLVAYGLTRSDDDGPETPPTIGVIQAPAELAPTQPRPAVVSGSAPDTVDLPAAAPGTTDIALPVALPSTTAPP